MSLDYEELTMIYQALINDSSVVALVSTAIYNAMLVPETETSTDTINFYIEGNFSGGEEVFNKSVSINCRSLAEDTSKQIATAVFNALNREHKTYNSKLYFSIVTVLPTIPPIDSSDSYNTPLSIQIRRRG